MFWRAADEADGGNDYGRAPNSTHTHTTSIIIQFEGLDFGLRSMSRALQLQNDRARACRGLLQPQWPKHVGLSNELSERSRSSEISGAPAN